MMKKVRRSPMESSPSPSSYPVGEESRAQRKHQSLMQDYEELLKETEAKKLKLHKTIQKRLKLLAEVKFLRRKYKSLSKNPIQETQYRMKKQSRKAPSPTVRVTRPQNPVSQIGLPRKEKSQRVKEATTPSAFGLLDLNQISMPSSEEMQEFQVEWEPLDAERLKKGSVDIEMVANDLKLSICRDGSNSNRVGKRKISWQDPVALRV